MSYAGPPAFRAAIKELSRLPGIGEKSAQRLVFHLFHADLTRVDDLSAALRELKSKVRLCSACFGLTEEDPCTICCDPRRDADLLCVVEDPADLFAVENSGRFRGVYHVLHGRLAPLDGVGPDQLKVRELFSRVRARKPHEVILATNPDVEGDTTALYLAKYLAEDGIKTSRIAMGIPMGGHLEYADQVTLGRAILERRNFSAV